MGARRVQGDFKLSQGYVIATGQAVEVMDMVAYHANTITRASDESWGSAITTGAPTVADGGVNQGTTLTNALTGVKVSQTFPWGEGTLSSASTTTPTAGATIKLTLDAADALATAWNIYVETAAGSGTYKHYKTVQNVGGAQIVFIDAYGAGRTPPSAVAQGAKEVTQYNFAQAFLGVSNQRMPTSGPPAIFGTPTRPFGNSQDNVMMVCRGGVFEFDCVSASFAAGSYVGAAKASGNALLNQTVVAVVSPALAIGKVFKDATSVTKVIVEIESRYLTPAPSVTNAW